MTVRTLLLPAFTLALTLAVAAAPRPAAALDCDTAIEPADMLACARLDLEAATARMALAEAKTLATLRPTGRNVFLRAQETWTAWRDGECAWNAYDTDTGRTDTLTLETCRSDLTQTRADDLESALEIIH